MTSRRSVLTILVVLASAMAFVALGPASAARGQAAEEQAFVASINRLRASKGLSSLAVDQELVAASRVWAQDMANVGSISHASDITAGISQNWLKVGENVGVGPDVDILMDAFIASPTHYDNLVDPSYNRVGVGVVWKGNVMFTTHRFMNVATASPTTTQRPTTTTQRPTTTTTRPITTTTRRVTTTTTTARPTTTTRRPTTTTTRPVTTTRPTTTTTWATTTTTRATTTTSTTEATTTTAPTTTLATSTTGANRTTTTATPATNPSTTRATPTTAATPTTSGPAAAAAAEPSPTTATTATATPPLRTTTTAVTPPPLLPSERPVAPAFEEDLSTVDRVDVLLNALADVES